MAHKTIEQKDAQAELERQFGKPDIVALACTHEPYGILWLHWGNAISGYDLSDRNLFILPGGDRLTWVFER